MAMGYSDVMPLSMLQHVQINLEEYRGTGKKSKRSAGEEYEEKANAGWCRVTVLCVVLASTFANL